MGNWSTFKDDADGDDWDFTQTREHNDANELDTISNWANPAHDVSGNMTTIPDPRSPISSLSLTYDAWNRLVKIDGANPVATYEYDGLNRRVVKVDKTGTSDVTYDYYYNTRWQCLEVHEGGDTQYPYEQYVWHPYYIDALATRWFDSDTDGQNIAQHYFCHDANANVTTAVDTGGSVVERYHYTPYGKLTVLDDDFSLDSVGGDGKSDIANPYTFTGRRFDDETGLYQYRNRYYGAEVGRFVTRDGVGYSDGGNLYAAYFAPGKLDPYGDRVADPAGPNVGKICAVPLSNKGVHQGARWIQEAGKSGDVQLIDQSGISPKNILAFVKKERCCTLYVIGHQGGVDPYANWGGAVSYTNPGKGKGDDATFIFRTSGKNDGNTTDFVRSLAQAFKNNGCNGKCVINIVTCGGTTRAHKKTRDDIAKLTGCLVCGSTKNILIGGPPGSKNSCTLGDPCPGRPRWPHQCSTPPPKKADPLYRWFMLE